MADLKISPTVRVNIIHKDGPTVDEAATSVLALLTTIHPDGLREQRPASMGPDGAPLSSVEVWRAWSLLACDLASRPDLPADLRQVCVMMDRLVQSFANATLAQVASPTP